MTSWLRTNDSDEWERIGRPSLRGTKDEFAWKFLIFIFSLNFLKNDSIVVKSLGLSILITMTIDYIILATLIYREFAGLG